MSILRTARWLLLALAATLIPATSHAGVFISVGFAPPPLPVYVQPDCPQPGLVWTPGYWAYDYDQQSYYWVDGSWVEPPYPGALWTPGYWGWSDGVYVFHPGYWADQVGYYGGVDYGFGYDGIGYTGGEWRGGVFFYNIAITHVDRRYIHRTFEDRNRVDRGYFMRGSRVAFSGGPGGLRYQPSAQERMAEHERHVGATSFQQQHESAARGSHGSYGGGAHPQGGGAGPGREGTINYNASKSNTGNFAAHGVNTTTTRSNTQHNSYGLPISTGAAKSQAVDGMAHRPTGGAGGAGGAGGGNGGFTRTYNPSHSNTGNAPSHPQPQSHPQSHPAPQQHEAHGNPGGHKDDHEHK